MDELLFFACSKISNQKKEHTHTCPSGSLRCSNELAGCELAALRQAHPETPAHPALLGKPERDLRSTSTSTSKATGVHHCRSEFIRTITSVRMNSHLQNLQIHHCYTTLVLIFFPFVFSLFSLVFDLQSPFGLSSTGRLGRIKHGACLSWCGLSTHESRDHTGEFTVPGPDRSAQSSRRPTHGAVFLWFCLYDSKD